MKKAEASDRVPGDIDIWVPLLALILVILFVSGCVIFSTPQERLAREADEKLTELEQIGCPSNSLFVEWSQMQRDGAPVPQWLHLVDRIDVAIVECRP